MNFVTFSKRDPKFSTVRYFVLCRISNMKHSFKKTQKEIYKKYLQTLPNGTYYNFVEYRVPLQNVYHSKFTKID